MPKYNNNKMLFILCIILTTSITEGKKSTNSIDTNKENKNSLTIKANYNLAQATETEKFPRNKEIRVSNPKIMVTNALQTKQNQRKIGKISEHKIEMLTVEKLPRKTETKVNNPNLTVTNIWWTKQNQRRKEKLPSYEEEIFNEKNNKHKTNIMKDHKRRREDEEKMNAQIWEEARAWEKEEKTERIAAGGRKEIKKRLEAKGIITIDEKICLTIQKEKNKLKQRRFTGALKETKRELETIIEAKEEKEKELKNLKERHRTEKRALKKKISEYKEQLYKTQEERKQITGNKEELEKERDYYKDREI